MIENARLEVTEICQMSWSAQGGGRRAVADKEFIVDAVANTLKDDPAISDLLIEQVEITEDMAGAGGHYHMVDGVWWVHAWEQCPDNPKNCF